MATERALDDAAMARLSSFELLWETSPQEGVWCVKYQHLLHRFCPVKLDYEHMPEPFRSAVGPVHEGKTGDVVRLTARDCFLCDHFVCNKGICDPI